MSATRDFTIQFEALVRGLTEGEVALVRGQITDATEKFLREFFGRLVSFIRRFDVEQETYDYGRNPFGFDGETKPITAKWNRDKNTAFGIARSIRRPNLWRGVSRKKGKKSLLEFLSSLDGKKATGQKLFSALGGIDISPISSGQGALKPGLVYSKYSGKAYNPRTKKYVSWKDAVDPAIDHYLKIGARQSNSGANLRGGKVTVPGRRGSISVQRAVVEGLVSVGINVSYLDKLNGFIGANSDYDELASVMAEAGLFNGAKKQQDKLGYLQRQGHGILLPYFGTFLQGSEEGSLLSYLKKEGVL